MAIFDSIKIEVSDEDVVMLTEFVDAFNEFSVKLENMVDKLDEFTQAIKSLEETINAKEIR